MYQKRANCLYSEEEKEQKVEDILEHLGLLKVADQQVLLLGVLLDILKKGLSKARSFVHDKFSSIRIVQFPIILPHLDFLSTLK